MEISQLVAEEFIETMLSRQVFVQVGPGGSCRNAPWRIPGA